MFQQFRAGLRAGDGRRGRHLRLPELHVVGRLQVEGQSALRTIQRPHASHDNLLEIGKRAAGKAVFRLAYAFRSTWPHWLWGRPLVNEPPLSGYSASSPLLTFVAGPAAAS